jgi:hypothetical protein
VRRWRVGAALRRGGSGRPYMRAMEEGAAGRRKEGSEGGKGQQWGGWLVRVVL